MLRVPVCAGGRPPVAPRPCVQSSCTICKGVQKLRGPGGDMCADEQAQMAAEAEGGKKPQKWEKFAKVPHDKKDGAEGSANDFGTVETAGAALVEDLGKIEASKRLHDDHAYLCARDNKYKRNHVPLGFVHSPPDLAEHGKLTARREIQSLYFRVIGYTLFGVVIERRIEDLTDIDEDERQRLLAR